MKVGDLVKFAGDNNPDIGAFFGIITEMSEDHPTGAQNSKFAVTMEVFHCLMIDSSGHKIDDGLISLGGDPFDESKFIR